MLEIVLFISTPGGFLASLCLIWPNEPRDVCKLCKHLLSNTSTPCNLTFDSPCTMRTYRFESIAMRCRILDFHLIPTSSVL